MPSTKKAAKRAAPRTASNDVTISKHLLAWEVGDTAAVVAWLDGGGQVDATGEISRNDGEKARGITMLINASGHDYADLIDLLLERGANLDAQQEDGWTALHWCRKFATEGNVYAVEVPRGGDSSLSASFREGADPSHVSSQ